MLLALRFLVWRIVSLLAQLGNWLIGTVVRTGARSVIIRWTMRESFIRNFGAAAGAVTEAGELPLGLASAAGCASVVAGVLALAFVVGLILTAIYPIVMTPTQLENAIDNIQEYPDPSVIPRMIQDLENGQGRSNAPPQRQTTSPVAPARPQKPDTYSVGQSDSTVSVTHEPGVSPPPSGTATRSQSPLTQPGPSSSRQTETPSDPFWETALQRERFKAINSGDMAKYNQLVQEHRRIYLQRGVSPCGSLLFPQGCTP